MNLKNVKGVDFTKGVVYNGLGYYNENDFIPHGMGVCNYKDHQEIGMYQDGVLDATGTGE